MLFFKKIELHKGNRLVWVGIIITLSVISAAVIAATFLYDRTNIILTNSLRNQLLRISITEAANIHASDLDQLNTESDWKKPEWAQVVNSLHAAKYDNENVVFMYIFRKTKADPTKMEFVADADSINPYANTDGDNSHYVDVNRDGKIEPDGPDKLQWPGQPYDEAVDIPETWEAYDGPLTVRDLYTDDYGTVLTGYAPIKDDQGNVVAILGTDIKADDFFSITRQTVYPFLIFIVFLVFIILSLAIYLIRNAKKESDQREKIETLNRTLVDINKKLKELDEQKTEFISLASHQLRGPLTSIKGYASMMLEGDFGEIKSDLQSAIETIFKSSQSLVVLVGDYLDVSRMDQGRMKYDFSDFDLKPIVEQVVNEMLPNVKISNLELIANYEDQKDYFVHGDRGKLKQVISNLIDNSIKYTPKGNISLSLERNDKDKIFVKIKDTGVGIDPEVLPNLFERFKRAPDASQTNISGTGLGLYVAKKMMEAHRGRVWAESEGKGKGSTFIIELDAYHKTDNEMNKKLQKKIDEIDKELGE